MSEHSEARGSSGGAESPAADSAPERPRPARSGPPIRIGAVLAIAFLAGFLVWVFLIRDDGGSTSSPTVTTDGSAPVAVSQSGLETLAGAVGRPIYWAGPREGDTYELTKTAAERVFIRYLPEGVEVGVDEPYLTVGTYPMAGAFSVTSDLAQRADSVPVEVGGGGVAFYSEDTPESVYLAFPEVEYQIEVYDPSPEVARELVASGQIVAIAGTSQSGARAVTEEQLVAFAGTVDHPIYWAGAEAGATYELSEGPQSSIFVRYLPEGTEVGVREPFLTIGSYPLEDAYEATETQSSQSGAVKIATTDGSVAFYQSASPTNVYLAFPGTGVQIEVYDPSPERAQELVASGAIQPVD